MTASDIVQILTGIGVLVGVVTTSIIAIITAKTKTQMTEVKRDVNSNFTRIATESAAKDATISRLQDEKAADTSQRLARMEGEAAGAAKAITKVVTAAASNGGSKPTSDVVEMEGKLTRK